MTELRIAGIVDDSITDGPGIRYTIFTQGCAHNCPGCHNPKTHDYKAGQLVKLEDVLKDAESFKYIKGVTFSGGEPFDQPAALKEFVDAFKGKGYHVLAFSGYTFEQLKSDAKKFEALRNVDILIDGKFDIRLRSLGLRFKGSSNQRTIDVQKTFEKGEVVLAEI